MQVKSKILVTLITLVVAFIVTRVLSPVVELATNATTVAQLNSTNSDWLIMNAVRGGDWTPLTIGLVVTAILLFIWTRDSK
jgi:preprotein translocase subunit SecY